MRLLPKLTWHKPVVGPGARTPDSRTVGAESDLSREHVGRSQEGGRGGLRPVIFSPCGECVDYPLQSPLGVGPALFARGMGNVEAADSADCRWS